MKETDVTEEKTLALPIEEYEKRLYDLQQLVEIAKSLCSVLDYSNLVESIIYMCMAQMRVLGAGVFVLESFDADHLNLGSNFNGMEVDPALKYSIPLCHPIVSYCIKKNKPFILQEFFADNPLVDTFPELTSLKPSLVVPLVQKSYLKGILLLGERLDLGEGVDYSEYEMAQIESIASLIAITVNNATLIEQTTTDTMTHLRLKHYFYSVLSDKLDISYQQKVPMSVLMLDIDFFKHFNDEYGHACGDFVLQSVARIIMNGIRGNDMAARYGGEEFVVMLHNTPGAAAVQVAERIRKDIENQEFVYEGNTMRVTISIGVSVVDFEKGFSSKQLVEFADKALYYSKRNGRNRVTLATEEIINSNLENHCK
ncbi:MAG: sensor domain-containing diguanylate cyclase [Spirochaetaceae bacterium]|nr:sensor domain-containing diguanylate cyclase [Spirochaetaceae bacterium]